ncbi:MAG: DUF2130 domain-containing protein [Nitrospirota bacterium]
MSDQTIICPHCSREIPLTETLSQQIRESIQKELEAEAQEKEKALKQREKILAEKEKEIENAKSTIEQQVLERLKVKEAKLKLAAKAEAESALQIELKDLKEQVSEKEKKLKEAQGIELEMRKKSRELEERHKSLELEVARKIDAEREKIRQDALIMLSEDHRLKDIEKDKKIEDLCKKIDELKRKADQSPIQIQGEVLELDLEVLLKARFPHDVIEPVPRGMRGADILQKVINATGQPCGTIIWETKRTKAWSDSWISKLKEDQREVKAEIAVIVSEVLPKGISSFSHVEGVWIASPALAGNVAEVLRLTLIQVSQATLSSANKDEKMELLYNYLSGPTFRQKVEAIVEAFVAMKEDLDKEKRVMTKNWAKREKQIEKVIMNTAGMYGNMQGIIGISLPEIKLLETGFEDESTSFEDAEH